MHAVDRAIGHFAGPLVARQIKYRLEGVLHQCFHEHISDGKQVTLDSARHWENPGFPQRDNEPAVCVSWEDAYTAPVGSFKPNAFGLYDMLGNAWEWVEDCWNDSYSGAPADGTVWLAGDCSRRVDRGGSWVSEPAGVRSAIRIRNSPSYRISLLGLRVARTLP